MKAGLLEHYRVFVAIARSGSLTAAADQLDTNQPTVSRQLAALERELGVALFQRSSRSISLSDAGRTLLPHAETLVAAADAAAQALQASGHALSGRLRVACSVAFARRVLLPALPVWQARHPQLRLELLVGDALLPVIKSGIDVALRLGAPADSSLVQTPLGVSRSAVFGAARYLDLGGRPRVPADLVNHSCLLAPATASPWRLADAGGHEEAVAVRGGIALSSVDLLRDAVQQRLGLAMLPTWFWRNEELAPAGVERVLPGWLAPPRPLLALTATRPGPRSKAAAFIAFVREAWRRYEPA
ncbi:MAG: LysR family transcriptional regulator [Burkholderiales bacterium]|jgi:DNA-binding transcriptional LysR family regulator|nr:LysR family transcriptional regulator [Burkholderiales bacterium]